MDLAVVFEGFRPMALDSSTVEFAVEECIQLQGENPEFRDVSFTIYPVIEYESIPNWVDTEEPLYRG